MSPVASTRWCPTPEQVMILEEMYRGGVRTPNAAQIQQITAHLSMYGKIEGKNVFYWFQNHKARDRQKLRKRLLGKQLLIQHHQHQHHHHQQIMFHGVNHQEPNNHNNLHQQQPHNFLHQFDQTTPGYSLSSLGFHQLTPTLPFNSPSFPQLHHHHHPQGRPEDTNSPRMTKNYTWKVETSSYYPREKAKPLNITTNNENDWLMIGGHHHHHQQQHHHQHHHNQDYHDHVGTTNTTRPLKTLELFPIKENISLKKLDDHHPSLSL